MPPKPAAMTPRPDDALLAMYDQALACHGDTAAGALWPDEAGRQRRYDVMLDLLAGAPAGARVVLCDLGCGTGGLLARIRERGLDHVEYRGLDRSAEAIRLALGKFPGVDFRCVDVLAADADPSALDCDYLVANGLFTVRGSLTEPQMRAFLSRVLALAWPRVRRGLAFNVMSKVVDWERDDLFHAPMDDMARLLHGLAGRRVSMRADYGLYEYTCMAFRDAPAGPHAEDAADDEIPVLRPRLPTAEAVLPWLRRMDSARVYSNFGPLVREFESRLAHQLALRPAQVASAGTGTAALVGAILAVAGRATRDRPLALMPAYTFVATAVAARECGYDPWLADMDPETWMLDPLALATHPRLAQFGVVIPVSAYGRPVPQRAWREFSERTGVPVVIDGAACIEAVLRDPAGLVGDVPLALSFHATKSLATGEGGCVLCTDEERVARATQAMNFGFRHNRDSAGPSVNGKMSEYHAAVGLAGLEQWAAKQREVECTLGEYRRQAAAAGVQAGLFTAPQLSSSYVLYACPDTAFAGRLQSLLAGRRIGFRHWYGQGLHGQTHFTGADRDPLPVTEALAPRLVGLPMAADLSPARIARIVDALRAAHEAA